MEGIQTLKGSWPWPWPSIGPYGISSCITHRPVPIYQISFKLKKLFVDGRTYGRTYRRTDISPLYIIRSTLESRPKNASIDKAAAASSHGEWQYIIKNLYLPVKDSEQEVQLSHRDRATLHFVEYFAKSLKVIWNGVCKSLSVFHRNYVCISYHFWNTQHQRMAWPWNRG